MNTTSKTIGFIATDGDSSLIHGIGLTAEEAREDAKRELIQAGFTILDAWSEAVEDFPDHYIVRSDIIAYPATQALLDTVGLNGGSGPYAWEVVGGVARLADGGEADTNVGLDWITLLIGRPRDEDALLGTIGARDLDDAVACLTQWAQEDGLSPQWSDAEALAHLRRLIGGG